MKGSYQVNFTGKPIGPWSFGQTWFSLNQSQPYELAFTATGCQKMSYYAFWQRRKKRESFIKKVCKESGLLTTLFCFVPFITQKRGGRRCSIVISIHFCWLINFICNLCIFGNYKNWNVYYRPGGENSGAKKNNDSNSEGIGGNFSSFNVLPFSNWENDWIYGAEQNGSGRYERCIGQCHWACTVILSFEIICNVLKCMWAINSSTTDKFEGMCNRHSDSFEWLACGLQK